MLINRGNIVLKILVLKDKINMVLENLSVKNTGHRDFSLLVKNNRKKQKMVMFVPNHGNRYFTLPP